MKIQIKKYANNTKLHCNFGNILIKMAANFNDSNYFISQEEYELRWADLWKIDVSYVLTKEQRKVRIC